MLNGFELEDGTSQMLEGFSLNDDSDEADEIELLSSFGGFDAIGGGDDDGFRDALASGVLDADSGQGDEVNAMLAGFGVTGTDGGEAAENSAGFEQDDEVDAMLGGFSDDGGGYAPDSGVEPVESPPEDSDGGD